VGGTITASQAAIISSDPTWSALRVRGAASQTANLQEWQNDSGTVLAQVGTPGTITIRPVTFSANQSQAILAAQDTSNTWTVGSFRFLSDGSGNPRFGFVAPNATTELLSLNGNFVGVQTASPSAVFQVTSNAAGNIATIVRGAASQTANLQEWQNSAGTALSWIDSAGSISLPRTSLIRFNGGVGVPRAYITSNTNNDIIFAPAGGTESFRLYGGAQPQGAVFTNGTASTVALIVQGATSQTADLQRWQNSSATVLAKVDASGNAQFVSIDGGSA
jgi:hypothetical protein